MTLVKLPPPVWTLIYALLAAGASWAAGWPGADAARNVPLGLVLFVLAMIPPVWAIVLFRRAGTELHPDSPTNTALVVAGPYRFTRNPMYLGIVVAALGLAIMVGAWPMFAVPVAVFATVNWVHIPFEQAKMRRQFAAAYDDYCRRVRRWL